MDTLEILRLNKLQVRMLGERSQGGIQLLHLLGGSNPD